MLCSQGRRRRHTISFKFHKTRSIFYIATCRRTKMMNSVRIISCWPGEDQLDQNRNLLSKPSFIKALIIMWLKLRPLTSSWRRTWVALANQLQHKWQQGKSLLQSLSNQTLNKKLLSFHPPKRNNFHVLMSYTKIKRCVI